MSKKRKYNTRRHKYSTNEKRAYYTGFGVGLADCAPSEGLVGRARSMMTDRENESYINGYSKGLNNALVAAGFRNSKKWF